MPAFYEGIISRTFSVVSATGGRRYPKQLYRFPDTSVYVAEWTEDPALAIYWPTTCVADFNAVKNLYLTDGAITHVGLMTDNIRIQHGLT